MKSDLIVAFCIQAITILGVPAACAEIGRSLFQDAGSSVYVSPKPFGDEACPCITADELVGQQDNAGSSSSYGIGCQPHDVDVGVCRDANDCASIIPLPADCDLSWCERSWCFVDPDNCNLLHRASQDQPKRYYSYATCGYMDSFTHRERIGSVQGRTYRVGFNSNSGGWKGAYRDDGWSGKISGGDGSADWYGPMVSFAHAAAREGGFHINITQPPEWLAAASDSFFGVSDFDRCVYATALGYLDFCVSAYTISNRRATIADVFEVMDDPIYLFVFNDGNLRATTLQSFLRAIRTVFQPFTTAAWLVILIFFPLLGLLMLFHERKSPGSAFPENTPVLAEDKGTGRQQVEMRRVPIRKHIALSIYMAFLAFPVQSYNHSVVTAGGKVNLLAMSLFIVLVLAVYTANLAAVLTGSYRSEVAVNNIDDAIREGYTFCSERKVADIVMKNYDIDPDLIVPDPVNLGGDGLPGFNCPDCAARLRVFDFMQSPSSDSSLYCNAAFASPEDLEVLHQHGKHCNKTKVGSALAYQNIGIPISSSVSEGLVSLFHKMNNEGAMTKILSAAQPKNHCPVNEVSEGDALNVYDMMGVWGIVTGFAALGLIVKWLAGSRRSSRGRKLQKYDQWGNPTVHDIVIDGHRFDTESMGLNKMRSSNKLSERIQVERCLDLELNSSSDEENTAATREEPSTPCDA